jgi:hypothetical protein
METVQLGAMRLGREQLVSTVDTNSSATLYSQKLQSKPRKQVQFNDDLTYNIPPMNSIIVDEYEGPRGPVIADEEMMDNLNPQLDTIYEWFTEAHNGMIGHAGCSSTVQRIRAKGHS